jgi:hypothetical protein
MPLMGTCAGDASSVGNLYQMNDRSAMSKLWARCCAAHLSGRDLLVTKTCPLKLRKVPGNHPSLSYKTIKAHDGLQAYQN